MLVCVCVCACVCVCSLARCRLHMTEGRGNMFCYYWFLPEKSNCEHFLRCSGRDVAWPLICQATYNQCCDDVLTWVLHGCEIVKKIIIMIFELGARPSKIIHFSGHLSACGFCVIASQSNTVSLCKQAAPLARHIGIYSFCFPISMLLFEVASSHCTFPTTGLKRENLFPGLDESSTDRNPKHLQWKVACLSFKCILKAFASREFWSDQPSQYYTVNRGLFFRLRSVVEYQEMRCKNIKDSTGADIVTASMRDPRGEALIEFVLKNFSLLYFPVFSLFSLT